MGFFNNKRVWITGASSGIGEALALAFAKSAITRLFFGLQSGYPYGWNVWRIKIPGVRACTHALQTQYDIDKAAINSFSCCPAAKR